MVSKKTHRCLLPKIDYISLSSFIRLIQFWSKLSTLRNTHIRIDCCDIVDLNIGVYSVLGLLLEQLKLQDNEISFTRLSPRLLNQFIKHEFIHTSRKCASFELEKEVTVLKYKSINADDDALFSAYIHQSIKSIPLPNNTKDMISKIIMEIFLNVKIHARLNQDINMHGDKEVFFSGYYNESNDCLTFTICNAGLSFKQNMLRKKTFISEFDCDYIAEAITQGMSTKEDIPGGMGLYFLHNLIEQSEGFLSIFSGRGCYEITHHKNTEISQYDYPYTFPGTLISVSVPVSEISKIPIQDTPIEDVFSILDLITN